MSETEGSHWDEGKLCLSGHGLLWTVVYCYQLLPASSTLAGDFIHDMSKYQLYFLTGTETDTSGVNVEAVDVVLLSRDSPKLLVRGGVTKTTSGRG